MPPAEHLPRRFLFASLVLAVAAALLWLAWRAMAPGGWTVWEALAFACFAGTAPWTALCAANALAGFAVLMGTTRFGRASYAIGNSWKASRLGGIAVARNRVLAYTLAGAMSGLAGLVWISQYQSARGDNADGTILFVVTAVVLGGVSIKGGSGRALGVLLAIVLLGTLQTGMRLANVPGTSQTLVVGLLLVASIGLPRAYQLVRAKIANSRPAESEPEPAPLEPATKA